LLLSETAGAQIFGKRRRARVLQRNLLVNKIVRGNQQASESPRA